MEALGVNGCLQVIRKLNKMAPGEKTNTPGRNVIASTVISYRSLFETALVSAFIDKKTII